ncbi:DUF6907 domain-containing protein [Streptomyces liliifuscus]|uniref:Uncharacterized protein n=1 Tax=Streptomyces liliifuscus TaxID=2797636 RepID=A0A7T7I8E8_9ACTN|nr:hypothetical protein [Streptomyces liliifuscus]QQM42806.1 hypothetical protein JEQ17_27550 [Streptomyces liliifuscus]
MTEARTVTLQTLDAGEVTLPEPSWCVGHADHQPDNYRADILHQGEDVVLTFRGHFITDAGLVQSPFATHASPGLGGRTTGVSVSVIARTLDPAGLYSLAASLDGYADRLRDMADQLSAILAGGAE